MAEFHLAAKTLGKTAPKASLKELHERSSLHKIINTKEKADRFMKQLRALL